MHPEQGAGSVRRLSTVAMGVLAEDDGQDLDHAAKGGYRATR